MTKKIELLGIGMDNYTVRESLLQVETYMSSHVLSVIESISVKRLLLAASDPQVRECIAQSDLVLIDDREILVEAGKNSPQRMREIRDNLFFVEFLNRMAREQKKIFLLAMTWTQMEHLKNFLWDVNENLQVYGEYALEEGTKDLDDAVNEMNAATPDIVLSVLKTPYREEFLLANRGKISASIWYGLEETYDRKPGALYLKGSLSRYILHRKLRLALQKERKK